MGLFKRFIRPRRTLARARADQAVLVHLVGPALPDDVRATSDLALLENRLTAAVAESDTGEFDANEVGASGAVLHLYGLDAEALYAAIEPVLLAHALCKGAEVTIRAGGVGAPERHVRLP
jgi:hypothetical protein